MIADIVITDVSNNTVISQIDNIKLDNKHSFEYKDNSNNLCKINVLKDGLQLDEECSDHSLKLYLTKSSSYALVCTEQGDIKLNAKIVDFLIKNDILVMRYIVEENEREIKVIYRS